MCWRGGEKVLAPAVEGPGDGCRFVLGAVFRGSDIVRGALAVENCDCCWLVVVGRDVFAQTVWGVDDVEDDVIVVEVALGMAEL